ncbi:MAG TPA: c-type cytochrome [Paracoccaceae bacterium]|nr:c-type cytochrome [Paracoccaceae bacterium]
MRYLFAAAAVLVAGPVLAQDDLAEKGLGLFQQNCRQCHIVKEGEHRLGPSLYGVFGREVGSVEGFSFSSSLASSTRTWDAAHLDAFIANPSGVYGGTRMLYAGMSDPENRKALVAYLASEEAGGPGAEATEDDGAEAGATDSEEAPAEENGAS